MTPITPTQLTTIRDTIGQFTHLYLAKFEPNIVFQAQINDASILKGAKTVTFDNVVTGSYSNIVNGQSLYIGTQQGGLDLGRVRVRSASSSALTVAVDDGINYADNNYLTVRDYHEIWPVFPLLTLATGSGAGTPIPSVYKDWDISYSDQNLNFDPVVIMGPDYAGFYQALTGGVNGGVYFTATGSYTVDGSTISTYAWVFPSGCSITSSSSGTPGTVAFPAPGMYTVSLTVTASNGKSTTAYRHVMILNRAIGTVGGTPYDQSNFGPGGSGTRKGVVAQPYQDIDDWTFDNITEDSAIGATAKISVGDRANEFRDGDLVIIFTEEWYNGGVLQSFGGYPGREAIKFVGYVDQAETTYDFATSKTTFLLKGTASYLQNKEMFSVEVHDTQSNPSDWFNIKNMTINKILNHYVRWHSTILNVKDYRKITTGQGDYTEDVAQFQKGELLNNLSNFVQQRLFGLVSSDRQGTLYTEIDLNITLTGSRPASVMTFVEDDWLGTPKVDEIIEQPLSNVMVGGVAYNPSIPAYITGVPLLSRAPGQWQTYVGKSQNISGLTLTDQAQLNSLAGLYFAKMNNETPEFTLELANNFGNIDIFPQEFYDFNISGTATYRGFPGWSPKRIIPRKITYKLDKFALKQTIQFEPETYGPPGDTIVIPVTVPGGVCTDCVVPPPCDCVANPACDGCPPPIGVGDSNTVYVFAGGKVGRTRNFLSASPNWVDVTNTTAGSGGEAFNLDPWNPVNGAYRLYANVLEKTTNLNSVLPTWTSVLTSATVASATGLSGVFFTKMSLTIVEQNTIYVISESSSSVTCSTSLNGGTTWSHNLIKAGPEGWGTSRRIIASNWTAGKAYFIGVNNGFASLYVTTDHGASWNGIFGLSFNQLLDFDVSYPDREQTIVVKANGAGGGNAHMWYSTNGGASFNDAGAVISPFSGVGAWLNMNCATQDQTDWLWGEGTGDFWHSSNSGASWTRVFTWDTGHGSCPGANTVAVGRWPYDKNKCYWLYCPGGVSPESLYIGYSNDLMATKQDKTGDWNSAVAAFSGPVMIVPLWLGY